MKFRVLVRAGAALACAAVVAAAPARPNSALAASGGYQSLASDGNVHAQAVLGRLYLDGGMLSRDNGRAFQWLLRAARQGDLESQTAIADLYREGRGIPQDSVEAAHWYGAAADRSPYAAWRLGRLFETGDGVARNLHRAAELYEAASRAGLAAAQNSLANLYLGGVGVPVDYAKALELYRAAAEQGFSEAELNLAGMYFQGLGVGRDYERAYEWARRALAHRAPDAPAFLVEIGKCLAAN
jgi:TPR repeat protein